MKNLLTTVLTLWVASLIGMILTVESLGCSFVLCFTAFACCSYALRYNSNTIKHDK